MKVALVPFFGQQNKVTNRFRLDSDAGVTSYAFLANRMVRDAGWQADLWLPPVGLCEGSPAYDCFCKRLPYPVELCNLARRLQWHPQFLLSLKAYDLVLMQHEFLAYPLRCLGYKGTIISERGLRPNSAWEQTSALWKLAHDASNAVHSHSWRVGGPNSLLWQMGYDKDALKPDKKTYDVLFNSRGSSTNYTNHIRFWQSMVNYGLSVKCTDPTGYLHTLHWWPGEWLPLNSLSRPSYYELIGKARVVVNLMENGTSGYSMVEAVASGAVPVVLKTPENVDIFGEGYPLYCTLDNVCDTVQSALQMPLGPAVHMSYQDAWPIVRKDIGCILTL